MRVPSVPGSPARLTPLSMMIVFLLVVIVNGKTCEQAASECVGVNGLNVSSDVTRQTCLSKGCGWCSFICWSMSGTCVEPITNFTLNGLCPPIDNLTWSGDWAAVLLDYNITAFLAGAVTNRGAQNAGEVHYVTTLPPNVAVTVTLNSDTLVTSTVSEVFFTKDQATTFFLNDAMDASGESAQRELNAGLYRKLNNIQVLSVPALVGPTMRELLTAKDHDFVCNITSLTWNVCPLPKSDTPMRNRLDSQAPQTYMWSPNFNPSTGDGSDFLTNVHSLSTVTVHNPYLELDADPVEMSIAPAQTQYFVVDIPEGVTEALVEVVTEFSKSDGSINVPFALLYAGIEQCPSEVDYHLRQSFSRIALLPLFQSSITPGKWVLAVYAEPWTANFGPTYESYLTRNIARQVVVENLVCLTKSWNYTIRVQTTGNTNNLLWITLVQLAVFVFPLASIFILFWSEKLVLNRWKGDYKRLKMVEPTSALVDATQKQTTTNPTTSNTVKGGASVRRASANRSGTGNGDENKPESGVNGIDSDDLPQRNSVSDPLSAKNRKEGLFLLGEDGKGTNEDGSERSGRQNPNHADPSSMSEMVELKKPHSDGAGAEDKGQVNSDGDKTKEGQLSAEAEEKQHADVAAVSNALSTGQEPVVIVDQPTSGEVVVAVVGSSTDTSTSLAIASSSTIKSQDGTVLQRKTSVVSFEEVHGRDMHKKGKKSGGFLASAVAAVGLELGARANDDTVMLDFEANDIFVNPNQPMTDAVDPAKPRGVSVVRARRKFRSFNVGAIDLGSTGVRGTMVLLVLGLFAFVPAFQYTADQELLDDVDGNQCHFNNLCRYDLSVIGWFHIKAFNSLLSNLGYIFVGGFFILWVSLQSVDYHCYNGGRCLSFPDPAPYRMVGMAFVLEGFFSAIYHVCPTLSNFQFDTIFMFFVAGTLLSALYGKRHRYPWKPTSFFYLFCGIVVLNMVGIYLQMNDKANIFWGITVPLAWLTLISLFSQVIFERNQQDSLRLLIHPREALAILKLYRPARIIWLLLVLAGNMALFLYMALRNSLSSDTFLTVLILDFLLYATYYTFAKLRVKEKLPRLCIFFAICLFATAAIALPAFLTEITDKVEPLHLSRELNRSCLFLAYDLHDLWHMFSAWALLFLSLYVYHIDDHAAFSTIDFPPGDLRVF